ncbi:unnamed protein product [Adineta ricciae]|uniref:Methyltransferase type 11 domain-containing protein n=1 Tax=Adineta ricciae TaxID=249248 RepID=A0A815YSA0_ADIRI|nr:unnamed protein product [Adineta ricciae]
MASSRNLRRMKDLTDVSKMESSNFHPTSLCSDRVSIDGNQQLSQRLKTLEDFCQKQNIHIQECNKKIEKFEKQIQELEDKVIELQQCSSYKKESQIEQTVQTNNDISNPPTLQLRPAYFLRVRNETKDEATIKRTGKKGAAGELEGNRKSSQPEKSKVCFEEERFSRLSNDAFIQWMDSRQEKDSLWANQLYRRCLLSYIARMYNQQSNTWRIVKHLRIESDEYKELDQLQMVIQEFNKQPGAKESLKELYTQTHADCRFVEIKTFFEYTTANPSVLGNLRVLEPLGVDEILSRYGIKAYLDLECRNGFNAAEIGDYLHLGKADIFGGNQHNQCTDRITCIHVDLKESTIDLVDNRVDLITCLVILHRVPKIDSMLTELVRVLRPNGYLIIREHNCKQEYSLTAKYLNFVQAVVICAGIGEYSTMSADWNEQKAEVIKYTSSIHYRTREEWGEKLKKFGFNLRAIVSYDSDMNQPNPQKLFYGIYQLNTK